MSFNQHKRTIYQAQINNAQSIRPDETLVNVLLKNVKSDVTKNGNNPGTTYYKLLVVKLGNEPVFIKMKTKKKKQKTGDNDTEVQEEVEEEVEEVNKPKGTTIDSNEEFMVTTYDANASTLSSGMMVQLAMTTDFYKDRFTFQAGSVIVDNNLNILCDKEYKDNIIGTKIAEIPTINNMSRDDFNYEMDEKYMNRVFILPLSVDNPLFPNVEIQIADDEKGRFFTKKKDKPTQQFIGVNTIIGDKTVNMFRVVYTSPDDESHRTMMTLAYMPEVWDCFGCMNVEKWDKVAKLFIFNAVEWYVYGYSNLVKLESLIANKKNNGTDSDFDQSTGFVTRMNVNLTDTVKKIGIPLSLSFIEDHFGSDSDYQNDVEYETHPLNSGWKVNVRRDKPYTINFTDLSKDQTESFIKEVVKINSAVQFYGIFSDQKAYEFATKSQEDYEAQIRNVGLVPDMVFAINKQ